MNKIIKIDIDSVIRDIHSEMLHVYNASLFKERQVNYEDLKDFDVSKVYPGLLDAEDFFFRVHAEKVFGEAKVCEKAVEGLSKLKKMGHRIILVSAQYKHNMALTINWLLRNEIPFDEVCFVQDKSLVKGDFILDDNVENLYSCIPTGEHLVCLSRPWNSKWTGIRVTNIVEFADFVDSICSQNIK